MNRIMQTVALFLLGNVSGMFLFKLYLKTIKKENMTAHLLKERYLLRKMKENKK